MKVDLRLRVNSKSKSNQFLRTMHFDKYRKIWKISPYFYNIPQLTWWVQTVMHPSVSTVSEHGFRTQEPGVESAVEGHVSSQNHMQSCWQDPDHVRASCLNTTHNRPQYLSLRICPFCTDYMVLHTNTKTIKAILALPDPEMFLRWRI